MSLAPKDCDMLIVLVYPLCKVPKSGPGREPQEGHLDYE